MAPHTPRSGPGASGSPGGPTTPAAGSEVRFALLGPPALQALRFLTKVALSWFLTSEELGSAMLAGLFVFFGQHAALLGMDDALVQAPRLGRGLWRRSLALTHGTGLVGGALVALSGLALGAWLQDPRLGPLAVALAPTVWLGNLGVLPTALLLRARAFRRVLWVDGASVLAFSLVTLLAAVLGAGPWSLVLGWGAGALGALITALAATRRERAEVRHTEGDEEEEREATRYGLAVTGASLVSFSAERADGLAVGVSLGTAALGLYEWALQLTQFGLGYARTLAERCLFPILSAERRDGALGDAHRMALRLTLTVLVPLHVALALVAPSIVRGLFPVEWHAAAPLASVLALAAGARTLEMVGDATLKASGRGGAVLRLSLVRLALLGAALAVTLPTADLLAVSVGVMAARGAGAAVSLAMARREARAPAAQVASKEGVR